MTCILRFALSCILNSLSYECDGGVDCILCILCRLIFEEAPLSGEVENRKVIRSCQWIFFTNYKWIICRSVNRLVTSREQRFKRKIKWPDNIFIIFYVVV